MKLYGWVENEGPDSQGTESRSVENKEFEKHAFWGKTGGLVENGGFQRKIRGLSEKQG